MINNKVTYFTDINVKLYKLFFYQVREGSVRSSNTTNKEA